MILTGPVVRIAPNEISCASDEAFKAIHNQAFTTFTKKGTSEELIFSLIFSHRNLFTAQDPQEHKVIRRALLPAFTKKALLEQQKITQYHVDYLVNRLLKASRSPNKLINLTENLNEMIWGISGDLAFGEPPSLDTMGTSRAVLIICHDTN